MHARVYITYIYTFTYLVVHAYMIVYGCVFARANIIQWIGKARSPCPMLMATAAAAAAVAAGDDVRKCYRKHSAFVCVCRERVCLSHDANALGVVRTQRRWRCARFIMHLRHHIAKHKRAYERAFKRYWSAKNGCTRTTTTTLSSAFAQQTHLHTHQQKWKQHSLIIQPPLDLNIYIFYVCTRGCCYVIHVHMVHAYRAYICTYTVYLLHKVYSCVGCVSVYI